MTLKKFVIGLLFGVIVLLTFLGSLIAVLTSNYRIPQVALFRNTELYDNSFNQQAYEGINEYGELTNNAVAESEVPPSIGIDNVTANKLFANGSQTIIANSYMYINWVLQYEDQLQTASADEITNPDGDLSDNQYIIFVDDDGTFVDKEEIANGDDPSKNVISMTFKAEEATFMAGLISCMYVVTEYPNSPEEWTLGIWGGTDYSAVNAIMSGYEAGIQFFNQYILGWKQDLGHIENTVKLINHQGYTNYQTYNNLQARKHWYSGSYNVDPTGKTQALGLITKGAKVITPVAGGQTINAINEAEIANNNSDDEIKVVGMDVDGKKQFPNNEDIFLTSAIKNIKDTIFINLLEIEAKNHPKEAAEKINENEYLDNYIEEEKVIASQEIKEVQFQETWGYDSKIPDPNNLSSGDFLHGVGISNPEENQGLYNDFVVWALDETNELVSSGVEDKLSETKMNDIVYALEFALDLMMKEYGDQIPNNSVSFTNDENNFPIAYYDWQKK